ILEHCDLARALLEDARNAEEVLRPLAARQRRPRAERLARRSDRVLDVLGAGLRDLRERLLVARRNGRERLTRPRLDPLAADEQAVPLAERDDVARRRSRS